MTDFDTSTWPTGQVTLPYGGWPTPGTETGANWHAVTTDDWYLDAITEASRTLTRKTTPSGRSIYFLCWNEHGHEVQITLDAVEIDVYDQLFAAACVMVDGVEYTPPPPPVTREVSGSIQVVSLPDGGQQLSVYVDGGDDGSHVFTVPLDGVDTTQFGTVS